jgi:hypothetical protein
MWICARVFLSNSFLGISMLVITVNGGNEAIQRFC